MPANEVFYHIYNRGIEKRTIFPSEDDYAVFLGYLKDYLSPPADAESTKKTFMVKGRSFRGVPHQPKNYKDKVELVAYSLMPDHFHLILKQNEPNSIQSFIRSLCTRYSMYFNRKHARTGPLFEGPYKSVEISDSSQLGLLTRHLHDNHGYSSYPEYLDQRRTDWIMPQKGVADYKNFVESYRLNQGDRQLLARISFENEDLPKPPEYAQPEPDLKSQPRILEFAVAAIVLLVLVGIGIRNIRASSPQVLPAKTQVEDTK